jgi:hypothetical protein
MQLGNSVSSWRWQTCRDTLMDGIRTQTKNLSEKTPQSVQWFIRRLVFEALCDSHASEALFSWRNRTICESS